MQTKDFSKISMKFLKNSTSIVAVFFLLAFLFLCFEIYIPANPWSKETVVFTVKKGWSDDDIAGNLRKLGIIRGGYFFQFYAIISLKHAGLKAGEYNLSPKMSIYAIVNKMAKGDVIRDKLVILEGWDTADIGKYLESKNICTQSYFTGLTKKDYSIEFSFLEDKPKNIGLEGYLFPDTYQIARGESCEDVLSLMLDNFNQQLTLALRTEIQKQDKSIFEMITMASLLEKEVRTTEDKKIVAGILWKRISVGMPLQLDSTVNYATGKSDPGVTIKDSKIDSPYNTYKYTGLPKGPISNPGLDSITSAMHPKKTIYWYYMTDGKTIFSETYAQHNAAIANHLAQ
jgi:UPF0755 protein